MCLGSIVHWRAILASAILAGGTAAVACDVPTDSLYEGYDDDDGPRSGNAADDDAKGTSVRPSTSKSRGTGLWSDIEAPLTQSCGGPSGGCHVNGTAPFLKGPDAYKSIKGWPGIVVSTPLSSAILTKGVHTGTALHDNADLEKKVIAWLNAEAVSLQDVKLSAVGPFDVAMGPNDIDLGSASASAAGVRLRFDAALVGATLQLTKLRIAAAPGQAMHLVHPLFSQVGGSQDPSDSFSNVDQTVAGGGEAQLGPGVVLFSGWTWKAGDKMKLELYKLEPGRLVEAAVPPACQNPTAFATQFRAVLQGQGTGAPINCAAGNCHGANGNGAGALNLAGLANDPAGACAAILNKLNKTTPANSVLFQKVATAGTPHVGGKVTNGAAFQAAFTGAFNTVF